MISPDNDDNDDGNNDDVEYKDDAVTEPSDLLKIEVEPFAARAVKEHTQSVCDIHLARTAISPTEHIKSPESRNPDPNTRMSRSVPTV